MAAINGVITVHGDQTEARNIEKEYTPGQKNVHTISEEDLQLEDYPHMDAMVIETNIDGWAVSKILVDGGSSANIIFTATLDVMKIDCKILGRAKHPLYGFSGKRIHSIG